MLVVVAEPVAAINKRLSELTTFLAKTGGDINARSKAINEVTLLCFRKGRLKDGIVDDEDICPDHFTSLSLA